MEKLRWYKNRQKIVHSRKESWFNSDEKEQVYKKNFTRIKDENDLSDEQYQKNYNLIDWGKKKK